MGPSSVGQNGLVELELLRDPVPLELSDRDLPLLELPVVVEPRVRLEVPDSLACFEVLEGVGPGANLASQAAPSPSVSNEDRAAGVA
jgi:hypothetical protein